MRFWSLPGGGLEYADQTYSAVIGRIEFLNDNYLNKWLRDARRDHPSVSYFIKKRIITDNLFGVDIMEEASEIAKLRLFLTLVASAEAVDQLEPLPNIDFNLLTGNSLIGLMHVDDKEFDKRHAQGHLFRKGYGELLAETKRKIDLYRKNAAYSESLVDLRDDIDDLKKETTLTLDEILLSEFQNLGIKFEQATWDEKKNKEGKSIKRPLKLSDITALKPFHWGFEFDEVINHRGGFDVIITNPPWEIFKPNSKEFFQEYSDLVTKKKMTIHAFEQAQAKLLQDSEVQQAWLEYLSSHPHLSAYFRSATQYKNQISIVSGKKAGSDINLYKLFTEQCFNLLSQGGYCGIVIPSGIYTDLGTKQLREMLFSKTTITGLFCFENRKEIFEGVHRSYKFLVLSFEKGGVTKSFPAAFMRLDVSELQGFPQVGAINVSVELIKKLLPDSLSVMEFKNPLDVSIAEKLLKFPLLGEHISDRWNLKLTREFDMTNDSNLFRNRPGNDRLPLYEGKMIHQFTHQWDDSLRFWITEREGRKGILGRGNTDKKQKLGYQKYRFGIRAIGRTTDSRTLIVGPIPKYVFCGNSILVLDRNQEDGSGFTDSEVLAVQAILNSLTLDYYIRQMVSANLNMFYIYQLPVPRLTNADPRFPFVVNRAARLICTTLEFDDLAKEVGLRSHGDGATNATERARLRAELDGMIAHLYGLTEEEFTHILSTFPLVDQSVKDAALDAYREFAPKPGDQEIATLIAKGESNTLEFKSSARWDFKQNKQNKAMEDVVVKTVAAMLNTDGGNLLIGVDDNRNVIGLEYDYKLFGKPEKRDAYENFLTTLLL